MSRACSIDYYFSPPQKRLMSPENSTRKVNTILKCQEINDIVLSCYGSAGEGDKCLALFTPFLPICDLFPCPSDCLCLLVYFSFIPHLPSFFPPSQPPSLLLFVSFPLLTMESRRQSPERQENAAVTRSNATLDDGAGPVRCVQFVSR